MDAGIKEQVPLKTKDLYTCGCNQNHMVEKTTNLKMRIISLYRSNYLAQFHVREMAKLTNKNHTTLLPHLRSLEKDKILVHKTVGKNKAYSLNFDNTITKEYIVLSEVTESIAYLEQVFLIKKINSEISKSNLQGTLILFGSYAKKTFKKDSDIDIFYLGEAKKLEDIKHIGRIYGKTINIKKASYKNFEKGIKNKDPLIWEVIKDHIILSNPGQFVNALWRYYDEIR